MARYPDSFIEEVKNTAKITEVVSDYTTLVKKSGNNVIFGCCPFHSEKTPSFAVYPYENRCHCYGCGRGGGVISFVMEIENKSFPEALEYLAERYNIPVPDLGESEEEKKKHRKKERMYELNKAAAHYFRDCYNAPSGAPARAYVEKRGISPSVSVTFGLGYAPDSWSGLKKAMNELHYSNEELFEAGLVRKNGDGTRFYDYFRNRLIFPLINSEGKVIGFSGRDLSGDSKAAKYMNTNGTPVYTKGANVFAINLAKKSKSDWFILVEGNVDVVTLHQAGFDSAVAPLGTALTPEQVRLIGRYKNEVILSFDSDSAGQAATAKAIKLLEAEGIKTRVLRMSGAKDPDEFIKLKGAEAFANLIRESENSLDYRLNNLSSGYNLSLADQKAEYISKAVSMLAAVPDAVKRQVYASKIAETAGMKAEFIQGEVEKKRSALIKQNQKHAATAAAAIDSAKAGKPVKYSDPASAAAEEGIVRLLYLEHSLAQRSDLPAAERFTSPELAHLYAAILNRLRDGRPADLETLLSDDVTPTEISLLSAIICSPENLAKADTTLTEYIGKLKQPEASLSDLLAQARLKGGYDKAKKNN